VDFEAELVLATMVDPAAASAVFEAGEANLESALAARRGGAAVPTSSGETHQSLPLPPHQQAPQQLAGFPFPAAALPAPVQPMQPRMSPLAGSAPGPGGETVTGHDDVDGQAAASDPFAFTDNADARRARGLY
jgi:hypothetical protein